MRQKPKIALTNDYLDISVILVDNEVDAQFDRISQDTIRKLVNKCVDSFGYIDDSGRAIAKITKAVVLRDDSRKVNRFEKYTYIEAMIHIDRNTETEQYIQSIMNAEYIEITVSFMVEKMQCSVCWQDAYSCDHEKGSRYNDELCCIDLFGLVDFYTFCVMTKGVSQ